MEGKDEISKQVGEQFIDYLKQTPKAAAVMVVSFFCGHLWAYVVTTFFRGSKTRGNTLLQSVMGRTALGLVWFSAVLVPIYTLKFRAFDFDYDRILALVVPTLVAGLAIQLIVFALCLKLGDRT